MSLDETKNDAIVVTTDTAATKAVATVVTDAKQNNILQIVKNNLLKAILLASLAMVTFFFLLNLHSFADLLNPRTVDVRSYGWSVAAEGNTSNQVLSDEGTPRYNFDLTTLVPDGTQFTGRIDRSWPRWDKQRKETFGNFKSASAFADEQGCRIVRLKVSGLIISKPWFRSYPVIVDAVTSPLCVPPDSSK